MNWHERYAKMSRCGDMFTMTNGFQILSEMDGTLILYSDWYIWLTIPQGIFPYENFESFSPQKTSIMPPSQINLDLSKFVKLMFFVSTQVTNL